MSAPSVARRDVRFLVIRPWGLRGAVFLDKRGGRFERFRASLGEEGEGVYGAHVLALE